MLLAISKSRCYENHKRDEGCSMVRAATKSNRSDGPRMVHVRLEPDLHRRLRIVVAAEDTSVQDWMVRLVEKAISEQWPKVAKERD